MNTQLINRLLWQVPVLIFLVAMLTPSISWNSSAIGAWPVWLLSMPFAVFVRYAFSNKVPRAVNHSMKSAQVLVFSSANPTRHSRRLGQKRAA